MTETETETASLRYRGLDTWDSATLLEALCESQMAAIAAVRTALPELEAAAAAMVERLAGSGRLVYAGAGASGLLALQDGLELPQTFGWPRQRLVLLVAGGDQLQQLGGAEDDAEVGREAVAALHLGAADVLLGVAASGTTPYTVAALEAAGASGALTVAIANNPDTPMLRAAACPVLLNTGAEVVAGSTRMKAGTAQKAALNLLSTLVMTRLGHVHDGYMVDMVIDNAKLRQRGLTILSAISGRPREKAAEALAQCQDRIKPAVLVLHGLQAAEALRLLEETRGSLRAALARVH